MGEYKNNSKLFSILITAINLVILVVVITLFTLYFVEYSQDNDNSCPDEQKIDKNQNLLQFLGI
jgi:heme/copper-type cytochrome/quinol oxidase subunit 2